MAVVCPNCNGKDSSKWQFGPCKVCNNKGITTEEKAKDIIDARNAYKREHGGRKR